MAEKKMSELIAEAKEDEIRKLRYIQATHLIDTASFLADMADSFMADADFRLKAYEPEIPKKNRNHFKALKYAVATAREKAKMCYNAHFNKVTPEKRIWVEDRTHTLYQMMKLIANRTDQENNGLQEIYNAVKALPIKREVFDETFL